MKEHNQGAQGTQGAGNKAKQDEDKQKGSKTGKESGQQSQNKTASKDNQTQYK